MATPSGTPTPDFGMKQKRNQNQGSFLALSASKTHNFISEIDFLPRKTVSQTQGGTKLFFMEHGGVTK